jgi:hypothetical protein
MNVQGRLSLHTGNVEWTFSLSEHSGNVGWTFRERWDKKAHHYGAVHLLRLHIPARVERHCSGAANGPVFQFVLVQNKPKKFSVRSTYSSFQLTLAFELGKPNKNWTIHARLRTHNCLEPGWKHNRHHIIIAAARSVKPVHWTFTECSQNIHWSIGASIPPPYVPVALYALHAIRLQSRPFTLHISSTSRKIQLVKTWTTPNNLNSHQAITTSYIVDFFFK